MLPAPAPQAPPQAPPPGLPVPAAPPQPSPQDMQEAMALKGELENIKLNKDVLNILRDEKTRGFRIEIETDSTIEPDESAEKQARVEFITATGAFMREAMPAIQMTPQIAPMIGEMFLFLVRGFRAGRG